jgi:NAD(P)-dependent dehydrogenase (short-subunit alcohol dehydrogenase family)
MSTSRGAALVTGTSTGIGRSTALALHDAGFAVYATARRESSVADLADRGLQTRALDVTDEAQMAAVVREVEEEHGFVSLLVNNAGYSLYAPVEAADPSAVRAQFETNVFGLVRMVQLVLPAMRSARSGRIVNVSSMGGRVTFPSGAFYHASKHAVEAITDALRLEVAPFGVKVVLIQPGPVRTQFLDNAADGVAADVDAGHEPSTSDDPYAEFMAEADRSNRSAYSGGAYARFALGPEAVARTIVTAATSDHPRPRYAVGLVARSLMTTRRLLPDQAWDAFIRSQYPTPRR